MSVSPVLQTSSGRAWPILSPTAADVHWRDVANSLARICRFNGHLAEDVPHYSVAQHCCLVADLLPPDARAYGLLHDAPEMVVGDRITPLKAALDLVEGRARNPSPFTVLEDRTAAAIWQAAGLPPPTPAQAGMVKWADLTLLATEKRDVMADSAIVWTTLPKPLLALIRPWSWAMAADQWLARLQRLCPAVRDQIEEDGR